MSGLRALAVLCLLIWSGGAQAQCRQGLALALDVSGSVDAQEYALQRGGVAAALDSAPVRAALLSGGSPVAVAIYEWSGPSFQRVLVPWTLLHGPAEIAAVTAALRGGGRPPAPKGTALGAALLFGAGMIRTGPDCARWTIDISGDGKNRSGDRPDSAKVRAALRGVTVNGLAIGSDDRGPQDTRAVDVAELSAYFRARVIHGPDAFVQVAIGYSDYAAAMERKLLREIHVLVLGDRSGADGTGHPRLAAVSGPHPARQGDAAPLHPSVSRQPSAFRERGTYRKPGAICQRGACRLPNGIAN